MRLLFVSNFYPPVVIGGMERQCAETAAALRDRGHEVWVLTAAAAGAGSGEAAGGTDRVLRWLELDSDPSYYRPRDFACRPWRRWRNRRALAAALGAAAPDLVVIWGMWNLSRWIPVWAERAAAGRVAYMIASYWPAEPEDHQRYWRLPASRRWLRGPKRLLGRWLAACGANGPAPRPRLDHVRCCSRFVRETLVAQGALPPHAGVLVPGVDPEPYARLSEPDWEASRWRLLYCGMLAEHKGVADAVEALARLRELEPERQFHLTLLGDGHPSVRQALEQQVARRGMTDLVKFVGAVPRDQVPEWLGRCQAFLFPSVWEEPLARAPLEALAAGRLVVGTTVGGMADVLADGVNALTFPAGEPDALARRIAEACRDPGLCRRLTRAGRRTVLERFTFQQNLDQLEAWLGEVQAAAANGFTKLGGR